MRESSGQPEPSRPPWAVGDRTNWQEQHPSRWGAPCMAHTGVAGTLQFITTGGGLDDGGKERTGFGHRPGEGQGGRRRGDLQGFKPREPGAHGGQELWLLRRPAGSQAQRPPRRSTGFLPGGLVVLPPACPLCFWGVSQLWSELAYMCL